MQYISDRTVVGILRLIAKREGINEDEVLTRALSSGAHIKNSCWLIFENGSGAIVHNHPALDVTQRYIVTLDGQILVSCDRLHRASWIADKLCVSLTFGREVTIRDTELERTIHTWVRDPKQLGVWICK